MSKFTGVKVLSASSHFARENLSESATKWINDHPDLSIMDIVVSQSSDYTFHCISISIFYKDKLAKIK